MDASDAYVDACTSETAYAQVAAGRVTQRNFSMQEESSTKMS